MKQRKTQADKDKGDKDVIDHLGDFIEEKWRKGISKVEEIFKDDKEADDKLFGYFKVFMDDKGVAAVTPSSKFLVERTIKAMDVKNAKTIVEYGAAQGVMTKRILQKLPADGRLLAIELNDDLYKELTSRVNDPRLITVNGDVRNITAIVEKYGLGPVDVIVSGVPFAFLSGRGRHELLKATSELLRPGGRFVAYQVTTHLIPLLKDYFRRVKTEFEIRNLPPHFVFTSFK
ncbi:MAG: methyltransferase domain-containing protein [Elusimicrobia bacterium]|nr:methyltransferase domain-containing protein [Elusimicrobiota bacterium]